MRQGATPLTQRARILAVETLEHTLNAVEPKQLLKSKISMKNTQLHVEGYSFDLRNFRNIYFVGGGKASGLMAEALEEELGNHVTDGVVNVPYGSKQQTRMIRIHEANHPLPDAAGLEGTRRIMEIADKADKDDLLIVLLSGGGSSLMPLPRCAVT
ncbi:MAG: DUF4147 domain-containing protein [Candidatus Bathyarchaeia archaeon]